MCNKNQIKEDVIIKKSSRPQPMSNPDASPELMKKGSDDKSIIPKPENHQPNKKEQLNENY